MTPLIYCQVVSERHLRGGKMSGSWELSIRPLCLALNPRVHAKHRWAAKRELGEIWRLHFYSTQRKKNSETVQVNVLPHPPFFFSTAKLLRQLASWHTFPLSFSGGNSDLGLLCFTSNNDFTSRTECCCGIKLCQANKRKDSLSRIK